MGEFYQSVYKIVAQIPYGKVTSYGQIARLIGRTNAARIVGYAMRYCPEDLPAHRVIKADGTIADGEFYDLQRGLLEHEDIPFLPDGRVDIAACRWTGE